MAALNFDARTVAPEAPRTPIPAGMYLVNIVESEVILTQNGGQMVKLVHEVLDGPQKGRKLWNNINYSHPSADAERIGQAQLSALCHAVGVMTLDRTEQLHLKPVRVRVTIRPAGPDKKGIHRDEQNEIKGYEAPSGPGAAAQAFAPPRQPAPAAASAPEPNPWQAAAGVGAPASAQSAAHSGAPAATQAAAAPWARRPAAATT